MSGRRVAAASLAAAALLGSAPALAASFTLSPAERAQALQVGRRSVTHDAFDAEWRVTNARGDTAMVLTPFHRLVLAGRHAAFRRETLKPDEPERLLREQRDRLLIWTRLHGARADFARYYEPRLLVGDREVEPAFVQNEQTAARRNDERYLARCVYGFPTRDITGTSRVLLVVRDADGRDVTRFAIDLSSMR